MPEVTKSSPEAIKEAKGQGIMMIARGRKPFLRISSFLCHGSGFVSRDHSLKQILSSLSPNFISNCSRDGFAQNCPITKKEYYVSQNCFLSHYVAIQNLHTERVPNAFTEFDFSSSHSSSVNNSVVKDAATIQSLMKIHQSPSMLESSLAQCKVLLTEDLVVEVLRRHHSDWKPAFCFFNWASNQQNYSHGPRTYNLMLDILGKMKQFKLMRQLVEEIPAEKRGTLVTDKTFAILLHRYAAGHKVEEAIDMFYRRKEFGLNLDTVAFQTLLLSLCRYKHVEVAESLFQLKKNEFPPDIKSRNIILNGWCVLGNSHEVKRFWNDIITSGCKPNLFTYGIFINSLTKAGKLGSAVKLFTSMWEKGCPPDVAICNCIIDALCFKKKIPDALRIFSEMNGKGCEPDVSTYNSLIKHLCKIKRMDEAYKLLEEMEQKGYHPNGRTCNYFLKSMKKPEEVPQLLWKMEEYSCKVTGDTYNLILKLFISWDHQEGVRWIWDEMEKNGLSPDQRSYTIMVHGLYGKGRMDEASKCFEEMISKGMIPEPRTKLLVKAINMKNEKNENDDLSSSSVTP